MKSIFRFIRSSCLPCCALSIAVLLWLAPPAVADFQQVGKIVVDKFELAGGGLKGPGANIIAHWELDDNFKKQTLFKESELRWLQLLSCSDKVAGLTPTPNRPFVDPRKGQLASGHPNGEGDDLPFYDFSFPTLNDATKNENVKINGSGPYLRDDPRALIGQTSINFSFMTLVVGIQADMRATALGAFTWGFDVDKDGKHTLALLETFPPANIGLGRFTTINEALQTDFGAWGLPTQRSYSADTQYYLGLTMVPEPASLCGFVVGIALVASRRRQKSVCRRIGGAPLNSPSKAKVARQEHMQREG
jgi:hypothetical protein